jgi:hypothetical protein
LAKNRHCTYRVLSAIACYLQSFWNSAKIPITVVSVKAINWRDEKLYEITARDYGDPFGRALGVILYAAVKGLVITVGFVLIFVEPRLLASVRVWYLSVLPLTVASGVWAAFSDRCLFVCEIEIYSDRIIRHSGDKTIGIGRSQVLSLTEGSRWTLFGRTNGLIVRGKDSSIFIPAECGQYAEIKAKIGGWQPIAG